MFHGNDFITFKRKYISVWIDNLKISGLLDSVDLLQDRIMIRHQNTGPNVRTRLSIVDCNSIDVIDYVTDEW